MTPQRPHTACPCCIRSDEKRTSPVTTAIQRTLRGVGPRSGRTRIKHEPAHTSTGDLPRGHAPSTRCLGRRSATERFRRPIQRDLVLHCARRGPPGASHSGPTRQSIQIALGLIRTRRCTDSPWARRRVWTIWVGGLAAQNSTTILPVLAPASSPMNASAALSMPCITVSSALIVPSASHPPTSRRKSSRMLA
jgi:hypothetical protein